MLLTLNSPPAWLLPGPKRALVAAMILASESLRSSTATSFCSKRTGPKPGGGWSLGNVLDSCTAYTVLPSILEVSKSTGRNAGEGVSALKNPEGFPQRG